MNHDLEQQAESIHQDVPLAPTDLLAAIVAAGTTLLRRPHGVAVNDRGTGRRVASYRSAQALTQHRVNPLPDAGPSPGAEIVEVRGPWAVLTRQLAPGASSAQEIEDAVEHPAQVNTSRTPTWLGRWEQGFEQGPFTIGEITGIEGENCRHATQLAARE